MGTEALGPIFEDSLLVRLVSLASCCLDAWLRTTPQGCLGSLLAQKPCNKRESFERQDVVRYQFIKSWPQKLACHHFCNIVLVKALLGLGTV